MLESTRLQLKKDQFKVKQLLGNNPFIVKNYVQGEKQDNSLTPLRLLKPKEVSYADDDAFIDAYLKEKK